MLQDHFGRHAPDSQDRNRICAQRTPAHRRAAQISVSFIDDQKIMRRLINESILPSLELDVSDVAGAADRIADWLEETGGLWAR